MATNHPGLSLQHRPHRSRPGLEPSIYLLETKTNESQDSGLDVLGQILLSLAPSTSPRAQILVQKAQDWPWKLTSQPFSAQPLWLGSRD
ncbi:MAG: hypothetical protein EBT99_00595 [Betaproteobacteria bacterium]|nr:hypothetical protein [Betaproteobacteria bacterium]